MPFTRDQRQEFRRTGWLRMPQVVAAEHVRAARELLEQAWTTNGVPPECRGPCRAFDSYRWHPEITGLLHATAVAKLADEFTGATGLQMAFGPQIAVRFFREGTSPAMPTPHVDGLPSPFNGVPKGTLQSFTLLVGILLSDVTQPYAGNLVVWEGSHESLAQAIGQHGHEGMLQGHLPEVPLSEPQHWLGQAGDVVFCHYLLRHSGSVNMTPHPRHAVYFRLAHPKHQDHWKECLADPWLEWPAFQE